VRFLLRLILLFEPLAPTAIGYFLSRQMRDWERQGLINSFSTHTKRLGKFHYKVEVEVQVNEKQVHYILSHRIAEQLNALGRWFNV